MPFSSTFAPSADDAGQSLSVPQILETLPQQTFDDFAILARALCGASMALVLLPGPEGPRLKAQLGVAADRLPTLLAECFRDWDALAGPTPAPRTPMAEARPGAALPAEGFRRCLPLLGPDGRAVAAVCVLDDTPRVIDAGQEAALAALGRQAAGMLERRHRALQVRRLLAEREYLHGRMEGIQRDLEQRNAELHRLASHDALTGLLNRGALDALVGAADSRLFHDHYTVAMLDIDHFKWINDAHGHPMGDEALRRVAAVIADCVRGNDIAARYGGEEFAVVMPGTHVAGGRTVVERIRQGVQDLDLPFPLTLSAGLAAGRADGAAPRAVFVHADQALYLAKQRGRNQVVAYEQ